MQKKYKWVLLGILGIILFVVYLTLFMQKGIVFENKFLRRINVENGIEYRGTVQMEPVTITLQGDLSNSDSASITYRIGDWYNKTFTVNAFPRDYHEIRVTIYKGNVINYDGVYRPNDMVALWGEDGLPDMGEIKVIFNNDIFYDKNTYEVSNYDVVKTAFQDNISIRGNGLLLFFAIIILAITAIDIRWPLLFFRVQHAMSVYNPEPSDFYLGMQKIGWVVMPVIALGLLIASLLIKFQ